MSSGSEADARREAFALSMVDLFGCGFIAAIFLFFLNMMQPQLDAIEAAGGEALAGQGSSQGNGAAGPLFIAVEASEAPTFDAWPAQQLPQGAPTGPGNYAMRYDHVVLDSSALEWPLKFGLSFSSVGKVATSIRLTLGQQVGVVQVLGELTRNDLVISFDLRDGQLIPKVDQEFVNQASVELLPKTGSVAFDSRFFAYADDPIVLTVKWADRVERVRLKIGNQPAVPVPVPSGEDCSADFYVPALNWVNSFGCGLGAPPRELSRSTSSLQLQAQS